MTGVITRDRGLVRQRTEAARSWRRLDVAVGSLALLDPDVDCRSALVGELRAVGVEVLVLHDYMSALVRLGARTPDVVVVSAALCSPDLARLVEVVRAELSAPVLLAFRDEEIERIGPAVAAGALPAIERPYRLDDVLRAIEPYWPRRPAHGERLAVADLELDIDGYEARLAGADVGLTPVELHVLVALARGVDHVVLRDDLARRLWPTSLDPVGVLVATVTKLRRKLAAAGAPEAIRTVRGLGYRLESAGLSRVVPSPSMSPPR